MCQSASRAKLILGLSSTSKVEDLWTTRLGTAYCQCFPFSLIVVALGAMCNSSHLNTAFADYCPLGFDVSRSIRTLNSWISTCCDLTASINKAASLE